jgi:hypothetical protein
MLISNFIQNLNNQKVSKNLHRQIETDSNLNSKVLYRITQHLGIDYQRFQSKEKLIDERLVKNRNEIAHGKNLSIDYEMFNDLHQEIFILMDCFKIEIENAAIQKLYRR